jgi:hypothetical protein
MLGSVRKALVNFAMLGLCKDMLGKVKLGKVKNSNVRVMFRHAG